MSFEYNETAIKMTGNFAERFFKDFETYTKKYSTSEIFSSLNFENIKMRNALDNYILKNYSNLDMNNGQNAIIKRNMDRYLQAFYKRFMSYPTELLGSPFLRSPEIVDAFCPERVNVKTEGKFENRELRESVKRKYKENTQHSQLLYVKDRNTGMLTKEETNRLMHFFINHIGTDNKKIQDAQEEYIKTLIGGKKRTKDLEPKQIEFLAKYVNHEMLHSRLTVLGYDRSEIQNQIYIGEEAENLGGFENGYQIYINKNSRLNQTIPELIHTVCHETQHSIQELESKKNANSKTGLDLSVSHVLRAYYADENGYDVYSNNYRFEEIEKDAENMGYECARTFLDVRGFHEMAKGLDKQKKINNQMRQFEYDYRIDENGKKTTRERFLYNSLNRAIQKDPRWLNEYPALKKLYHKTGEAKTFEEILMEDFKLNNGSEIFEDFCKIYIVDGALEDLDLEKFSEEMQGNIASRLINILINEKFQLSDMDKDREKALQMRMPLTPKDQENVEKFHLKISRNIMKFVNQNYAQLKKLQDNKKFSSIVDMQMYHSHVKAFQNRDFYKNLQTDEETIIQELMELSKPQGIYQAGNSSGQTFEAEMLENSFSKLVDGTKKSEFDKSTHDIKRSIEFGEKENQYGEEEEQQ